jgi:hypothetical protein
MQRRSHLRSATMAADAVTARWQALIEELAA